MSLPKNRPQSLYSENSWLLSGRKTILALAGARLQMIDQKLRTFGKECTMISDGVEGWGGCRGKQLPRAVLLEQVISLRH